MSQVAPLRTVALLVHRYVGVLIAVFLLVAGLTGTLLVFQEELDRFFAPSLIVARPPFPGAPLLEPFELAARIGRTMPEANRAVHFDLEPDESVIVWTEMAPGKWREAFVSPYTGQVQGSRAWGDLSEGTVNLMPFLYRFHYSLALGDVGIVLFGIVGLLWTIDCFVGAYLTFPPPEHRKAAKRVSFLVRWLPAWLLRTTRTFSLVFTWHRASGLWVWAMLLVFAWSAVGLNLADVYRPAMNAVFGMREPVHDSLPEFPSPHPEPQVSLRQAHAIGQGAMAQEARERGFRVLREKQLYFAGEHQAYVYVVESSLDISSKYPQTELYIDARDGRVIGLDAATGIAVGNTITSWLYALHFAAIGGLWYRVLVAILGLFVAALSVTGVWIWWVKWRKRVRSERTERRIEPVTSGASRLAS